MSGPHHRGQPHHPDHTDADAGNEGGLYRISHAPQGTGEDLHRHEHRFKGYNDGHHIGAAFNDARVQGINPQNEPAEQQHQKAQNAHGADAHGQAYPHTLLDPVITLGTEILPHEGGDCHAEGAGHHPDQSVGFPEGRPGGHHHRTEGIDAGLDQGVGQIEGHKLQPRGNADEQNSAQQPSVQPEGGQAQGILLLPQQHHQQNPRADNLGKYRGQSHAYNPHAKYHHQHHIHYDVCQTGGDQRQNGSSGVPHGPQNSRLHIIHHGGQGPGKIDAHIGGCHAQALLRGAHPPEHPGAQQAAQRRHQNAQHQRQGKARMQGVVHRFFVVGAAELGQNHRSAGAESHKEAVDHIHQGPGGPHRRQGLGTDESAHDDGIHRIVHLLEKGSQQNREEKQKNLFPDDPFRNLPGHGPSFHGLPLPFSAFLPAF